MKYSIGGKINSNGDLLSYFESLDDKLSDIEKRRNIALKLNLDVEGRKEAEDLLEKFDEKSKNGMNNYFVTQAKGVRDLTKAWDKLDLIKNDLEYEEDAAKKASLQNRYDKQVNAIVRQANAYQALGYQVNDNIQKILEFSKAQEAVLQKRTGGQYQYTVQNFKDLFDVMKDLMPLLEKSDGLSKNLFHMSPQLSDVKEIEERAKKAEQYIKNVYEKYGDALLPDETQREVVRNYATTQGYSRVHKRITGQAASYSPEFNDAINNIRFSNSPIEREIFEQQVLRVESDYEKVLTALRKDAQKVSEAAQDDLVLSHENLVNEINESIQNISQGLDSTKSRISYLELEQQKRLVKEWGSFEGSHPRFSETGDIAGAYITNEAFTEANKLYDSLFEKIEQGAITSDEAINMMAEDLFKAVSKGEATPFLSDDVIKLQEEVDELKAKIVSLSEALQEAKSEAQDFANVANGTYENNLDLENQIDRLLRRIDEQQEEIDNLTRENDYLRDNQGNGYGDGYGDGYGSYSDDYVEGLQSTLQHLTDRIDSLEGVLSSQSGQMGDGQGDGKAPFGECCAILSGIKETLGSINFQGLNAMPEDVTSIRNVLNEISGSVEGLKDILASSDGQIAVTNVTNLGIGNEDDPEARQRYAELMDAYASVFNPRKTSRSFKDEAGNVVNKISEKISVTFDEIASAIITNLPTVGARYGNNVSAFKEIYSLERIQARPLQDRISLLTDLLGWIKELSKVDLGQELNSVIRKNSKGFPELTSESISNNQLGFANSVEAILKTLQEIARQVGGIFNALNAGATNDIPNFSADYLTDRGQILKDLFSKIATTGKGAISSRASNVANIKDFLNQFNTYGNGEWSLDEFARINDISKKNLEVLKKYNDELSDGGVSSLKTQEQTLDDILETEKEITTEKEKQEEIEREISEIKKPQGETTYLTDEHGKEIKWYRGTRGSSDVGAFESNRFGGATFWTTNPMTAATYGERDFPQRIYESLQASLKPFIVNANGRNWDDLAFFGLDQLSEYLQLDYDQATSVLQRIGIDSSDVNNVLEDVANSWNDIYPLIIKKVEGQIESIENELKRMIDEGDMIADFDENFSWFYSWLDKMPENKLDVRDLESLNDVLNAHGLLKAIPNSLHFNTKDIVDLVQKSGKFDSVLFKDIVDIGGGGSVHVRDDADREKFKSDIIVQFDPTHIKSLGNGPSQKYLDETWAKSIIEEFLFSYGRKSFKIEKANASTGNYETVDMSENIRNFRDYASREFFLKDDSVVQYFSSLPDEIGQKILDVLHSNPVDTDKYSDEIEKFITDYLLDILEYGGGVEEAYNKIKELDPDIETNSAYRKTVRFGLNQASSFLNDEDLKSLARDELKNSVALQIAPAFQNMQQLLSFGGAKEIRQALRDDGTIQTNLLSSLKEIIVQEIYDVWSDYLKSAPVSDMDVTNEAESEILEKREKVQQESIEDLKEEKELRQEINDLVEQKNALEKEEPQQGAENAEQEKESIKEINSLLEEQTSLEKESNSLEEADVGQDNVPITSVIEAIKEKTEAFEKEKETVDEVVEAEKQKLKELQDSVGKVTKAVKAKTDAFGKEGKVVVDTMQEEKEAILSLPSVITTPNGEVINPQSRNASSAASFNTPPLLPGGSANADDNPQDQFPEWEKITLRFIKAIESFDNMVEKIPEKIMDEEIHYQDVHGQAYRTRISDVVSGNLNIGGRQISLMDRVDAINAMPNGTASEMQAKLDEMQSLIPVINAYTSSIKEMIKSHGELADSLSMKKIQNRIQDYLSTNTNLTTEQRAELLRLKQALEDAFDPQNNNISMTKDEFRELLGNLELAEANIRRTGREGKNVFQKMAEQVGHLNERWIGQLLSFHDIIRYIRTMYTEIKNIDTALIELKKVTDGLTMERLNISLENSLDTARKLGSEVTEVINTTADWARLGYGIEDAEKLAEVTTLFKNVGDNMTTDAASEYLISTLKGFEMVPEEALSIVDKFNEVANNFAIDTAGIGTALERSSASFNAANTNLSESIALVTTANAVVQNPESVGKVYAYSYSNV